MEEIAKTFDPSQIEDKWYEQWLTNGCFNSDPDDREPYTIVIPPPNVTGVLHMGHVLNNTLQDVLIRRKRMEGYNACWVPGTDHASIATEAKVVAKLREEGVRKSDLTRDEFLGKAWEWTNEYGGRILQQLRKLGASCDWRRTRFTLDPDLSASVLKVFADLYEKGYVYRGYRMINWDPAGRTALSDEEVMRRDEPGKLYYVRYKIEGENDEWITIATTRPETIMADTAIAVHPEDERYKHLLGKRALLPFLYRPLPIIADDYIDPEFGTGCLKVTPAHDINDYEIGQRHDLEVIDLFDEGGRLNESAGILVGEDRFEAREKIVEALRTSGHLTREEEITHSVGYSERTNVPVEPRLSLQWFVKMEDLAKPAYDIVVNGGEDGVRLIPDRFLNTYKHWLENVRDWCISRQLWWGHRIPAYFYHAEGEEEKFVVALSPEEALEKARAAGFDGPAENLRQDEDVLDTWFSSWLWPMTVFDGINQPDNPAIKYYYPTNDLVTGPEILFFWVARMIIAGAEYRGQKPFNNVYLTGTVRDEKGRKMSKSLGNSPEPMDLINEYGADGVRFGMMLMSPAGNDLLFEDTLMEQGRNFSNKIWNAFRLIMSLEEKSEVQPLSKIEMPAVRWMHMRIAAATEELERLFSEFRISEAAMTLYRLIWQDFCSWYLELVKPTWDAEHNPDGTRISDSCLAQTVTFLDELMRLLHPFMPFITEEIWQRLSKRGENEYVINARIQEQQPSSTAGAIFEEMDVVRKLVTQARSFRAERELSPKQELQVFLKTDNRKLVSQYQDLVVKMGNLSEYSQTKEKIEGASIYLIGANEVYIPLEGLVDKGEEKARLQKELEYNEGFLKSVDKKLSNEKFVQNADPNIVERERKKKADAESRIEALKSNLENL